MVVYTCIRGHDSALLPRKTGGVSAGVSFRNKGTALYQRRGNAASSMQECHLIDRWKLWGVGLVHDNNDDDDGGFTGTGLSAEFKQHGLKNSPAQ